MLGGVGMTKSVVVLMPLEELTRRYEARRDRPRRELQNLHISSADVVGPLCGETHRAWYVVDGVAPADVDCADCLSAWSELEGG